MFTKALLTSALLTTINAYTQPGAQTFGALLTPNQQSAVDQGQPFQVTWQTVPGLPDSATVSLVLCNGPSANCVLQPNAIVEGVPASAQSYTWNVPCDIPLGQADTATGYGMLIIVDGTGQFQYSTQFSVGMSTAPKAAYCSTTSSSTSSSSSTTTSSSSSSSTSSTSTSVTTTSSSSSSQSSSSTTTSTSSASATSTTSSASSTSPGWNGWSSSAASTTMMSTTAAPASTTAGTSSPAPKTYTGAAPVLRSDFGTVGAMIAGAAALFAF